jgi:cobalamin synthase
MAVTGALFAGRTPAEVAEMTGRGPSGFGILTGVAGVLLRYALLLAVPAGWRLGTLLLAGGLSRAGIVWVCWRFRYAETDTGIGGWFGALAGPRDLLLALPVLGLGLGLLGPLPAGAALVGGWLVAHLLACSVSRQLGGLTAQAYYAAGEVGEVAALAGVAGLAQAFGRL